LEEVKIEIEGCDTIILGHSLGGFLARKVVELANKESNPKLFVTLGTNHSGKSLRWFMKNILHLEYSKDKLEGIPSLTFSGMFDPFAWGKDASFNGAKHSSLPTDHILMITLKRQREKIFKKMKKILQEDKPKSTHE
jgi:hypothetical protein